MTKLVNGLSERGFHLMQGVVRSMGTRERCIRCGFKIRGPNHGEGTHHKIRHPKLRRLK
jgi:hypothetical protein